MAISVDPPARLAASAARHELGYALYSDREGAAARQYGIAFRPDPAMLERYEIQGPYLPVPAVFLYNGGKMTFQYVNPDYKVRIPGDVLLAAARASR